MPVCVTLARRLDRGHAGFSSCGTGGFNYRYCCIRDTWWPLVSCSSHHFNDRNTPPLLFSTLFYPPCHTYFVPLPACAWRRGVRTEVPPYRYGTSGTGTQWHHNYHKSMCIRAPPQHTTPILLRRHYLQHIALKLSCKPLRHMVFGLVIIDSHC